jgi:tetratricopeptide (TPR) repeat protein
LGFSYSHLAEALLLAERYDEAREFAQRAIACATTSDPLGQASGQRTLSVLAAREGQREQAADHTARAFESARKRSSERDTALTHLYFAQVQRIFGDHAAARAELTAAKMLFERLGMAHHEALAQRRLNGELNGSG